jgi:hypothetical protein
MTETRNLNGLRGWLILVGIVVVASPLRLLAMVAPLYYTLFTDGSWEALTTPGGAAYNPLWKFIVLTEIAVNTAIFALWLFIGFLFFTRDARFPTYFCIALIGSILFIVADAFMVNAVLPEEPAFDPDTLKELGRSVVATAIWLPYTVLSKRVKQTFVH